MTIFLVGHILRREIKSGDQWFKVKLEIISIFPDKHCPRGHFAKTHILRVFCSVYASRPEMLC